MEFIFKQVFFNYSIIIAVSDKKFTCTMCVIILGENSSLPTVRRIHSRMMKITTKILYVYNNKALTAANAYMRICYFHLVPWTPICVSNIHWYSPCAWVMVNCACTHMCVEGTEQFYLANIQENRKAMNVLNNRDKVT